MTESQIELLRHLSTKKGVIPIQPERSDDLTELHKLGLVATNGLFAQITDEGQEKIRGLG